jgi:Fic family protein
MPKYIRQLPEWPEFRWDHEILAAPLASLQHRQGRLIGRTEGLGFSLRSAAVLRTLTEDVMNSSKIEGEKLERDQVRSSIARRLARISQTI